MAKAHLKLTIEYPDGPTMELSTTVLEVPVTRDGQMDIYKHMKKGIEHLTEQLGHAWATLPEGKGVIFLGEQVETDCPPPDDSLHLEFRVPGYNPVCIGGPLHWPMPEISDTPKLEDLVQIRAPGLHPIGLGRPIEGAQVRENVALELHAPGFYPISLGLRPAGKPLPSDKTQVELADKGTPGYPAGLAEAVANGKE